MMIQQFERAKDASADVQTVPMDQSLEIEEKLKLAVEANFAAEAAKRHLAKAVDKSNRLALAAAMATNSSDELSQQCRDLAVKEETSAASDVKADKKLEVVADEEELESNTQTAGGKVEGAVSPPKEASNGKNPTPDFKKRGDTGFNIERSSECCRHGRAKGTRRG